MQSLTTYDVDSKYGDIQYGDTGGSLWSMEVWTLLANRRSLKCLRVPEVKEDWKRKLPPIGNWPFPNLKTLATKDLRYWA